MAAEVPAIPTVVAAAEELEKTPVQSFVPSVQDKTTAAAAPMASGQGSAAMGSAAPSVQQSMLYSVGTRLREQAHATFAARKPLNEVFDRTSFAKPATMGEVGAPFHCPAPGPGHRVHGSPARPAHTHLSAMNSNWAARLPRGGAAVARDYGRLHGR